MFGKKKMQKEIDDLQSRLRVIETFTVPYASETKRANAAERARTR